MLAEQRDDGKARTLAHRIAARATRHQRAADEEADLRMDLAAIAGDAEELQRLLDPGGVKRIIDRAAIPGHVLVSTSRDAIITGEAAEEEPDIGLSWGGSSLIDVMEEAVQARERAHEEAEDAERFEALVLLGESAQAVHESRRPYVFNGSVYMVGKAAMEQLGEDLARYLAHRKRYVARKTAENRERWSNG